ncbi:MAG: family 4 glycosyl hydrolase [Nitrososphaerales archaeon]
MVDTRISFVGAGSAVFAMNIIRDLCLEKGLDGSVVTLMDVDSQRLNAVHSLANKYAEKVGGKIRFEKTTDLRKSLKDSEFVIDTALVGGHHDQESVRQVGEKHGYYRGVEAVEFNMIADYSTTFQGYNQLKFFLNLARAMEDECPDAWLIDVANPECEAGTLLTRESKIKVVGYCHGYKGYKEIPEVLGLKGNPEFQVAGFNHNIWLTSLDIEGKDLYPSLDEWIQDKAETYWNTHVATNEFDVHLSRAAVDMYKLYGLFPIGDTVRSGSRKYHYDLKTKQYWYGELGGPDSEIGWARYLKRIGERTEKVLRLAYDPSADLLEEIPPVKSNEDVIPFIDSIVNDKGLRFILDIRNNDTIPFLPADVAVEVPLTADRKGIHREIILSMPKKLERMALAPRLLRLEMAMEAFLNGDKSVLLEILYRDERTKSNAQAEAVLQEILNLPFNSEMKKHYS